LIEAIKTSLTWADNGESNALAFGLFFKILRSSRS
jgi:hypothetical protein